MEPVYFANPSPNSIPQSASNPSNLLETENGTIQNPLPLAAPPSVAQQQQQPLQRTNSRARSNTLSPPKPARPSIVDLGIPELEALQLTNAVNHTRSASGSLAGPGADTASHNLTETVLQSDLVNSEFVQQAAPIGVLSNQKPNTAQPFMTPSDLPIQESNSQRRMSTSTTSSMTAAPVSLFASMQANSGLADVSKLSIPSFDDTLSFAYFRKTDIHPRKERQVLYALHVRKLQEAQGATEYTKADKKKRGNAFSKLNAYLRKSKKKRTTAGLLHSLTLAIHDRRTAQACQIVNELTPQQVKKAPTTQRSKIFLYAAANRLESIVQLLLEKGFLSNVNSPVFGDGSGQSFQFPSFFMVAISFEMDSIIRAMIKAKADVNADWYGLTPLLIAAAKGNLSLVQLLLENGANANVRIRMTDFLLLRSLKRLHSGSMTKMTQSPCSSMNQTLNRSPTAEKFGICLKQVGSKMNTPEYPESFVGNKELFSFELAAACGHDDVCRLLLSRIDPKLYTFSQLCFLVQFDPELTFHFVRRGASLSQADAYGAGPLHLAARAGKTDQVLSLLQVNVPVNTPGQNGWTALHEAVSYSRKELCQLLVSQGADINAKNADGYTPVDLARRRGMSEDDIKNYFYVPPDPTTIARLHETIGQIFKTVNSSTEPRIITSWTPSIGSYSLKESSTLSRRSSKPNAVATPRKGRSSLLPKSSSGTGLQFTAAFGSSSSSQGGSNESSAQDADGPQPVRKPSKIKLFGNRK